MLAIKRDPLRTLDRWRTKHGTRFTMRSPGVPPMVFLSDPAEVRELFSTSAEMLHPGEGGSLLEPVVGAESWMLADEDRHLIGRTILKDAFTVATAERHAGAVTDMAERAVSSWPCDRPVALHPLLRSLTLSIIVHTIFGRNDSDLLDELDRELLAMLEVTASIVLPVPPVRRLPHGRGIWRAFLRQRDEVDALLFAIVDERTRSGDPGAGTLGTLLAARGADGAPLDRAYIRDSLMSVLVAGHETTSSALAWALLLLAHHPHARERLTQEIDEGAEAPYLNAVIYEALRHRPVFLFGIPRVVQTGTSIGGRPYPPLVYLMPCIYLIHHDARYYPQPHDFRPERFVGVRPDPHVWLPWGGGRKRCPGRHLALLEMRSVLRSVLGRLLVEPGTGLLEGGSWRSFIVSPRGGAQVVLRRRARG